jgi:hypothetical protein
MKFVVPIPCVFLLICLVGSFAAAIMQDDGDHIQAEAGITFAVGEQ